MSGSAVERLMVAVGPAPQSAALVQVAARMAARRRAPWLAVSVEPASRELPAAQRQRVASVLLLAERLGAETLVVRGDHIPEALLAVARAREVSRLLVGRPTHPRLRDRLRGSMLDELLRAAEGIEVLVTSEGDAPPRARERSPAAPAGWGEYALALGVVLLASGLGRLLGGVFELVDHAMLHLLAIVLVASRVSRGPALFATLAAVASFDLFFVPPYLTLRVAELHFLTSFLVMTLVGLVISTLTVRVREQAETARRREQRSAALYELTRALSAGVEPAGIAAALAERSARLVAGRAEVRLDGIDGAGPSLVAAGRGEVEAPEQPCAWFPVQGPGGGFGALGVVSTSPLDPEQRQLLELFAAAAGAALERAQLGSRAAAALVTAERERVRSSLLAAVSHDLRTPLASIVGGVEAALHAGALPSTERALLENAREEGARLGRLVQGLLDLTRLNSGEIAPRLEWWPASELVAGVRGRLQRALEGRALKVEISPPNLEIRADGLLLGQLLENLLDNALKYSPAGTPVEVALLGGAGRVRVEVRDRGPGVPAGEERRIFERFYRGEDSRRSPGAGLGLAVCEAVARVHGGEIRAEGRPDGPGACFVVELPSPGEPPQIIDEEVD